jgi:proton glutamate symport protein
MTAPITAPAAVKRGGSRYLPSITTQIFIGLLLGIGIGMARPEWGVGMRPLADLFLRMIKMIIAPLIFSTLVVGIAGTGDLRSMGRIGLKAIIWFELATTVALGIGLVMMNVFQPGSGFALPIGADTHELAEMATRQQSGWDIVLHVFPTSVVDAMARGDVLQIVVFATLFGIGLAAIGDRGEPLVRVLDAVAHTMFKVTDYVMRFAPIGVMAAIAATVGGRGVAILFTLGKLVLVMYGALVVFVLVVLGGAALVIRVPFWTFLRTVREPFLIAFTTASSEAALPKSLEVMERFGVPRRIVSFVLPTGYSMNLDGSTLYLSAASLFVAQIAGVHLSLGQQLLMLLTLMLTSKGVAGVPRAALVILTGTLHTFGLPLEGAAILLGIDQLLDMGRTAVNVLGNCIATAVVARWEGVLDDEQVRRAGAAA